MSWDERFIAWLEDPAKDAKRRKFFLRLGGLTATLTIITIGFVIYRFVWRPIFFTTDRPIDFFDILICSGIAFWIGSDEK